MRPVAVVWLVALLPPLCAEAQQPVTQADLLRRMIDLDRLTTPPPAGARTGMFSSYDRRSKLNENGEYVDWAANNDWGNFIRQEDGWDVMAEMQGPGAIVRVWSANPQGDIRFILDGEAVIDMPFADFLSGKVAPFEEPFVYRGLNCYFPLGYAESCKVLCRDCQSYYQVNYVQFPAGTPVERFKPQLDDAARAALADVRTALLVGLSDAQILHGSRGMPVAEEKELRPGDVLSFPLEGDGTVRALYVALSGKGNPHGLYALHRCVLRVFVDGADVPNVEAPLCDFFGSGFDRTPFNSLPVGTNRDLEMPLPDRAAGQDRFMYCYFPMPYRRGLRVEIENQNEAKNPIGLLLYLRVDTRSPADDALAFFARFRREDPCTVFDVPILETTGRGRIVGCLLNVDCPRAMWWGEGDEKVWTDGEKFPSYFGTGSEDYLGDAWGLHAHIRPLQGVTRTGPYGKNSAYRWHISDSIDFRRAVRFTIENWQFTDVKDTYYGTVAYWYGEPAGKAPFERLARTDLDVPGLRIPDAVEIEGHVIGTGWGNVIQQKNYEDVEFSGEKAVSISSAQPVAIDIPAPAERAARLKLRVNPRRPFDTVTVTDAAGRTVGTVSYDRATEGMYTVGVIRLQKGDNRVTVQCSRPTMLDCWVLEDLPRIAHAAEGEDLTVVSAGGAKLEKEYATLNWSAGAQLSLDFSGAAQTVTLALPEQKDDASVAVRLHVTDTPDGGRFQLLFDDQPVGEAFECRRDKPEIKRITVGAMRLARGVHTIGFRPLPGAGRRLGLDAVEFAPTHSPYALECEDLPVAASNDSHHERQGIEGASAQEHLWCRAVKPGAWIEFAVPVKQAGRYKLSVVYTRSWDYGIVQAYVCGEKAAEAVDTYAAKITPGRAIELGTFELAAEPQRVRVEVLRKSDQSTGYYFGVDCIELEPAGVRGRTGSP